MFYGVLYVLGQKPVQMWATYIKWLNGSNARKSSIIHIKLLLHFVFYTLRGTEGFKSIY